jgi:ABC transporter with metal-binding/Fe-S-binding domain ATP-binding protein
MKLAALLSGGKDSLYAAFLMDQQGYDIEYIINIISENPDSYMFHVPNAHLVRQQAKSMQIRLIEKTTKGEKETELKDLEDAIRKVRHRVGGIVSGAVASNYQKSRIDAICKNFSLQSFAPLWRRDPEELLREMLKAGFEIIITAVAAEGLGEEWLGRRIDERRIEDLKKLHKKYGVSINGEGGEYESLVLDCPLFSKKIEIVDAEKIWDTRSRSGVYRINEIKMVDK